jgi:hypothetical protein
MAKNTRPPSPLEKIVDYLSLPERLRPLHSPDFEPPLKRPRGRSVESETRKQITKYMEADSKLASKVDGILKKAEKFSVKDPKITVIRKEISHAVFGSEKRKLTDCREWLRNHYQKLARQKPKNQKEKTPRQ